MPIPSTHLDFVARFKRLAESDARLAGFSVGGSWATGTLDEFSDIDIVAAVYDADFAAVLSERYTWAQRAGDLLSGFRHHIDPRLLICLYETEGKPLHVDLKFVRLSDYADRVENPTIIYDRIGELAAIIARTGYAFPHPDPQDLEHKIWVWLHYSATKLGRGELLEAIDYQTETRLYLLSPLLLIAHGREPRRCRRVESLPAEDFALLRATFSDYDPHALLEALRASVRLYRIVRDRLAVPNLVRQTRAEAALVAYLDYIETKLPPRL